MEWIVYALLLWPAPERFPSYAPALFSHEGMAKVGGLVKGFVLSRLVHEGMTHEELRRILGDPSFLACEGGCGMTVYDAYAIQVLWPSSFKAMRDHQPEKAQEVWYDWDCWLEWAK